LSVLEEVREFISFRNKGGDCVTVEAAAGDAVWWLLLLLDSIISWWLLDGIKDLPLPIAARFPVPKKGTAFGSIHPPTTGTKPGTTTTSRISIKADDMVQEWNDNTNVFVLFMEKRRLGMMVGGWQPPLLLRMVLVVLVALGSVQMRTSPGFWRDDPSINIITSSLIPCGFGT